MATRTASAARGDYTSIAMHPASSDDGRLQQHPPAKRAVSVWIWAPLVVLLLPLLTVGLCRSFRAAAVAETPSTPSDLAPLSADNGGFLAFPSTAFSPVAIPRELAPSAVSMALDVESCAEDWIAQGRLCSALEGAWSIGGHASPLHFDVIYTWTNGTEADMGAMRETRSAALFGSPDDKDVELVDIGAYKLTGSAVHRHWRDHDELRYSLRSLLAAFPPGSLRTIHLIVGDLAASDGERHAQIPRWLQDGHVGEVGTGAFPRLRVVPHSEIFKTLPIVANTTEQLQRASDWASTSVPSFNSLAIESQLPNLDGVLETVLGMNDDLFINANMSMSDFASPLTGPVFRMQHELRVKGVEPEEEKSDADGEWRGLQYAAHLIDTRFGSRIKGRPYIVHVAKTHSTALLQEAAQMFHEELSVTGSAQFRGQPGILELQMSFLFTNFVVERHREALLWSFVVARSDVDGDGFLSLEERRSVLLSLGFFPTTQFLSIPQPSRTTLYDHARAHIQADIPPPTSQIVYSSADGYAYFEGERGQWPAFSEDDEVESDDDEAEETRGTACVLDSYMCFGEDFLLRQSDETSVGQVFGRLAFLVPACGDCVIVALVGNSGKRGFESFLPPPSPSPTPLPSAPMSVVQHLSLSKTWQGSTLVLPATVDRRAFAIGLIARYSYSLAETRTQFISILSDYSLHFRLYQADREGPALIAINDDLAIQSSGPLMKIGLEQLKRVDMMLKAWMGTIWPVQSRWELG